MLTAARGEGGEVNMVEEARNVFLGHGKVVCPSGFEIIIRGIQVVVNLNALNSHPDLR